MATNSPETFLNRFQNVTQSGDQWMAQCPAHKDDKSSLAIKFTPEGKTVLHCHAGCPTPEVVKAIGLEMKDLGDIGAFTQEINAHLHTLGQPNEITKEKVCMPSAPVHAHLYAEYKKLPEEFLKNLGVVDQYHNGFKRNVIRIPYRDISGQEKAVRYRIALEGDDKFRWKKGDKPFLYGLWKLSNGKVLEDIVLVEGESDCHTLWFHGYTALGLPGANTWDEERDSGYFKGFKTIFVIDEEDAGAEAIKNSISKSSIRSRVRFFNLGQYKDPSALHIVDPQAFKARFEEALKNSITWAEVEAKRVTQLREEAWEKCKVLAMQPDILSEFAAELSKLGFAGDTTSAKLIYLALTSRVQERPLSLNVNGPSSAGKSFLVEFVLKFFPKGSYHDFTSMSERNLAYTDRDLRHTFIILYEAAGMAGEMQNYLIRSLLSEGKIKYEFVDKKEGVLGSRLIEKEGPTGLIQTTTALSLHPENDTRLITFTVNDTMEQTKKIIKALAKKSKMEMDFSAWHALQTLIQYRADQVVIPYAEKLADLTEPINVRLRRDFEALLTLIKAHATLHYQTRDRDEAGRVIATMKDYSVSLNMIGPLIAAGAGATVTETIRETVGAVDELVKTGEDEITVVKIARGLNVDRSSAQRRVKTAVLKGYLRDLDDGKQGRTHRYTLADVLPTDIKIFPSPEELEKECTVHTQCAAECTPQIPEKTAESLMVCSCAEVSGGLEQVPPQTLIQDLSKIEHALWGHKQLFIDTETTGLDPHRDGLVLVQVKAGDDVFVIDAQKADLGPLKSILGDPAVLKVFQNAVFDVKLLKKHLGADVRNIFDTMIAERLLTAGIGTLRDCSLERLAKKYLGANLNKDLQNSFNFGVDITREQLDYARQEVAVLPGIYDIQKKRLEEKGLVKTAQLEFAIIPALAEIELKGVLLDTEKLAELQKSLEIRISEMETRLKEYATINFSSPQQIAGALKMLGIKVESTDAKTLKGIDHPFAKLMAEYREASKLYSSFAKKLQAHINPHTGRIHPEFLQCGTDTGRFSCHRPNLQQIPKEQEWRDLFVAPAGYKLITADYSQIELRILAEFSKDPKFVEAYKTGQDLHQRTADLIGIARDAAKTINFGIVYGMGPSGLSNRLEIKAEEAERIIDSYFKAYPKVKRTLEDMEAKPLDIGYTVTPLGRKRFFKDPENMQEHGEMRRQGRNTPIQATCGDILKRAILLLSEALKGHQAQMVNLVHDEIVIECPDTDIDGAVPVIRESMVRAGGEFIKAVPVEVNIVIGTRWKK